MLYEVDRTSLIESRRKYRLSASLIIYTVDTASFARVTGFISYLTEAQSWFLSLLFNLFSLPLSCVLQTARHFFPVDKESSTILQTYHMAPFQMHIYNGCNLYPYLHGFVNTLFLQDDHWLETETLSRYCSVPFWKLCTSPFCQLQDGSPFYWRWLFWRLLIFIRTRWKFK